MLHLYTYISILEIMWESYKPDMSCIMVSFVIILLPSEIAIIWTPWLHSIATQPELQHALANVRMSSGWIETFACCKADVLTVAKRPLENVLPTWGRLSIISSSGGTLFTGQTIQASTKDFLASDLNMLRWWYFPGLRYYLWPCWLFAIPALENTSSLRLR